MTKYSVSDKTDRMLTSAHISNKSPYKAIKPLACIPSFISIQGLGAGFADYY